MGWKEHSVTLNRADAETFETGLGEVTVSDAGVTVAFRQVEDWKRIRREIGDDKILREARWADVVSIDQSADNLYYPHIDITVDTGDGEQEKRLYFTEDYEEALQHCLNAVRRKWRAAQQRKATSGQQARRDIEPSSTGDEVALEPESKSAAAEAETGEDAEEDEEPVEEQVPDAVQEKIAARRHVTDDGIPIDGDDTDEEEDDGEDEDDGDEDGGGVSDHVEEMVDGLLE